MAQDDSLPGKSVLNFLNVTAIERIEATVTHPKLIAIPILIVKYSLRESFCSPSIRYK